LVTHEGKEPPEAVVVDDRQDAVRPVVELGGGDVAGEVGQDAVQILIRDALGRSFFPRFHPVLDGGKGD